MGHSIGLAQLFVGVLGLGTAGIIGVKYASMNQRTADKFIYSLQKITKDKLSKISPFLQRERIGSEMLNLKSSYKAVALIGNNRSGKTVFLSDYIRKGIFPWYFRWCFPPRGLFLTGSRRGATKNDWLRGQISTEKENPMDGVMDILSKRRNEQRVRIFLQDLFGFRSPSYFAPQPAIVVVDQAEELLRAYCSEFLLYFYDLAKSCRDEDLLRLVLVINSEKAVDALKLMNGGNMFDVIRVPKVCRDAVVSRYGEGFAKIFDDCEGCIGTALDHQNERGCLDGMSAKDFSAMKKKKYTKFNCLTEAITEEEFNTTQERVKK